MAGKMYGGNTFVGHPHRKRKGVHAKCRASKNKRSKVYLKRYRGQG
jgi:hypothetical protein